ncbi:Fic family protein [Candidatus Woesearchaeota archaeon]|nr:Fic family protein [Candidatus Woesearchaeota archaeon]
MKFILKKIIKGRPYYYFKLSYPLLNERYNFSKYIGPILPRDMRFLIVQLFTEVAKFIDEKVKVEKFPYFHPQSVKSIEHTKLKYILQSHELFQPDLQLFKTLFYILFVLNSNRAEGSKVTRSNIEEVMQKKVKPQTIIEKEVINSIRGINFAFSRNMVWNEKNIRDVHKHLFWNIHPEIAGKYKRVNNIVGNEETTEWQEVHKEMKNLLIWFQKEKGKMYGPQLALEFYWRFEAIHPFEDGNGRVGRILLNRILLEQGYAPVVFFSENHQAHCNAISKAKVGKTLNLAKHFIDAVNKTNNAIIKYKKEQRVTGGSSKVGQWEISRGKIRIG